MTGREPIIDVWITKYALSSGIKRATAELCLSVAPNGSMIGVIRDGRASLGELYHKPYWSGSETDAIAQAERMRVAKIASLRKQIAKLEAMKF
jgi:hypothetical protein